MNYIAITEVKPKTAMPPKETSEDFDKALISRFKSICTSYDKSVSLPPTIYKAIQMSEETFNFIQSVASVSCLFFGEKEYKINDLKFKIYTEEEYEKQFGKLEV